ncbi:MAG TPA: hypothetical protein VFH17_08520 [Coriobacteriia bacterium]|nr:hypothetical protein [Coriobacteriia bacterium]
MRRTTGAGHVANEFVDEVPGVSQGTTVDAPWLNPVQEELCAVVESEGESLDGTGAITDQVWKAIAKRVAQRSKPLGELFFLQDHRAVSEWNDADPDAYFAGVCLDDGDKDIAVANYPDLVPYLLTRVLTYKEGVAGEQSTHNVTTWAVAGGVATLTFANLAPEIAVLTALLEDKEVHGGYASWRSITLAGAIGNILAGTYAITEVNAVARTVKFAAVVGNGGAGGAWTVQFFTHKVAGSATARVFQRAGGAIMSANDPDNEAVPGLRRRDRGQGHAHYVRTNNSAGAVLGIAGSGAGSTEAAINFTINRALDVTTDGTNGTPRTGKSTDPRNITAHLYVWARTYIA